MTDWGECIVALTTRGETLEPGLSEAELSDLEDEYCFRFPESFRDFLHTAVPSWRPGKRWMPWRAEPEEFERRRAFRAAKGGVLLAVLGCGFWLDYWGARPQTKLEAAAIAVPHLWELPRLVPLGDGMWMPVDTGDADPPVIYYDGGDWMCRAGVFAPTLRDYLMADDWTDGDHGPIPFWDGFIRWGDEHLASKTFCGKDETYLLNQGSPDEEEMHPLALAELEMRENSGLTSITITPQEWAEVTGTQIHPGALTVNLGDATVDDLRCMANDPEAPPDIIDAFFRRLADLAGLPRPQDGGRLAALVTRKWFAAVNEDLARGLDVRAMW